MQSKKSSLIEAVVNVGSGMILSFGTTQLLANTLDIEITYTSNAILTCVLTSVSIVRSYFWRRLFNKLHGKRVKIEEAGRIKKRRYSASR